MSVTYNTQYFPEFQRFYLKLIETSVQIIFLNDYTITVISNCIKHYNINIINHDSYMRS